MDRSGRSGGMSDFSYPNAPKEETRRDNLDLVRRFSSRIYSRRRRHLRLDVLDLCGENAPFLQLLLEEDVLGPARYIGVDSDAGVIDRCRERYAGIENVEWYGGDMLARLRGDVDAWPDVGLLNYDSQRRGAQEPIEKDLELLGAFARARMERHGEFLLVVNATTAHDGMSKAKTNLVEVFHRCFEDLDMGPDSFHTYTSVGHRQPMVHLQLRMGF